ncbi:nuclear transport factor 2 family protein [Ferruginibacter sp.]
MQPTNTALSQQFSGGNFKFAYDYLAEDIVWNIIGDKILKGKKNVIAFCDSTAAYFATVTTKFTTGNLIADSNCVAIDGTAEFINKENKITHVSSCDVYRFENGTLKEITSYCIVTDKK